MFYATTNFADQHVMVVDYSVTGGRFSPGKARRWSDTPVSPASGRANFDVSPDGKRILTFPFGEAAKGNMHLTFLVNFHDELKRKMQ